MTLREGLVLVVVTMIIGGSLVFAIDMIDELGPQPELGVAAMYVAVALVAAMMFVRDMVWRKGRS